MGFAVSGILPTFLVPLAADSELRSLIIIALGCLSFPNRSTIALALLE